MRWIIIIALTLIISIPSHSQLFKKCLNRYDKEGRKHGRWIEYWDATHSRISGKGRFEHGRETRKWIFYHFEGKRRLKFKYSKEDVKVKYYYPSGKLESKGWARFEYTDEEIKYYWRGRWKFYDRRRKPVKISIWDDGEEIKVLYERERTKTQLE